MFCLLVALAVEFDSAKFNLPAVPSALTQQGEGDGFAELDRVEERMAKLQGEIKTMGIQVEGVHPSSLLQTGGGPLEDALKDHDKKPADAYDAQKVKASID